MCKLLSVYIYVCMFSLSTSCFLGFIHWKHSRFYLPIHFSNCQTKGWNMIRVLAVAEQMKHFVLCTRYKAIIFCTGGPLNPKAFACDPNRPYRPALFLAYSTSFVLWFVLSSSGKTVREARAFCLCICSYRGISMIQHEPLNLFLYTFYSNPLTS